MDSYESYPDTFQSKAAPIPERYFVSQGTWKRLMMGTGSAGDATEVANAIVFSAVERQVQESMLSRQKREARIVVSSVAHALACMGLSSSAPCHAVHPPQIDVTRAVDDFLVGTAFGDRWPDYQEAPDRCRWRKRGAYHLVGERLFTSVYVCVACHGIHLIEEGGEFPETMTGRVCPQFKNASEPAAAENAPPSAGEHGLLPPAAPLGDRLLAFFKDTDTAGDRACRALQDRWRAERERERLDRVAHVRADCAVLYAMERRETNDGLALSIDRDLFGWKPRWPQVVVGRIRL